MAIELDQNIDSSNRVPGELPIFSWNNLSTDGASDALILPLYFADRYLGSLRARIDWKAGWSVGGFGRIGATVGFLAIGLIAAWVIAFVVFRRLVFAPLMEQALSINRHAAIAEAVQMVAHDVRKPFTSLRICLAMLRKSEDPKVIRKIAAQALPEIESLASGVESMLAEILNSERPGRAAANPYRVADILKMTVEHEVRTGIPNCQIDLSFEMDYGLMTTVDSVQLRRIVGNIAKNAVEAMHGRGKIWVKLRAIETHSPLLCEILIGNSGDPIPANVLPQLFDSYFTRGKVGGTGLGLANAKKFVTVNGGTIRCRSGMETGTEFIFILPVA